jgi:hypothetical protein
MFRSDWTILREPIPNLAKVIILWNYSVKLHETNRHIAAIWFMNFYGIIPQNFNFSKVRHRLPEDGPVGPKHVGANMRYFNCTF